MMVGIQGFDLLMLKRERCGAHDALPVPMAGGKAHGKMRIDLILSVSAIHAAPHAGHGAIRQIELLKSLPCDHSPSASPSAPGLGSRVRDAADVAVISNYGPLEIEEMKVEVTQVARD